MLCLPQQFLCVRLSILWAGLIVISNWIISQRNIVFGIFITASMRWMGGELFPLFNEC